MTEVEKQEIENVVGNYAKVKKEHFETLHEIYRKQREGEIYWHIGESQIIELYKQLGTSDERIKFVEMTKIFMTKDDEFEKYFHSVCLREFNNIHISPDKL